MFHFLPLIALTAAGASAMLADAGQLDQASSSSGYIVTHNELNSAWVIAPRPTASFASAGPGVHVGATVQIDALIAGGVRRADR